MWCVPPAPRAKPGAHAQAAAEPLPAAELVPFGQLTHAPPPSSALYVPAAHGTHAPPPPVSPAAAESVPGEKPRAQRHTTPPDWRTWPVGQGVHSLLPSGEVASLGQGLPESRQAFGVWGVGFEVWGLGFGVEGVGIGVWALESQIRHGPSVPADAVTATKQLAPLTNSSKSMKFVTHPGKSSVRGFVITRP